jgi:NADPH:quinone reductase-like Zn-dependent oxidoreductase
VSFQSLYRNGITVMGYGITVMGSEGQQAPDEAMAAAIREAMQALAAGRMSVPIDSLVPLAQVNEGLDRIKQRDVRGKIVLDTRA